MVMYKDIMFEETKDRKLDGISKLNSLCFFS